MKKIENIFVIVLVGAVLISCNSNGKQSTLAKEQKTSEHGSEITNQESETNFPGVRHAEELPLEELKWASATGKRLKVTNLTEVKQRILNAYRLYTYSKPQPFSAYCQQSYFNNCRTSSHFPRINKREIGNYTTFNDLSAHSDPSQTSIFYDQYIFASASNNYEGQRVYDKFDIFFNDSKNNSFELIGTYRDPSAKSVTNERTLTPIIEQNQLTHIATIEQQRQSILVELINVENKMAPTRSNSVELEGNLVAYKRINDTLYLITNHEVTNESLLQAKQKNEAALKNTIASIPIDKLLPTHQLVNMSVEPSNECLLEDQAELGYLNFIFLTAIDLKSRNIKYNCIGGSTDTANFGSDSVFITSTKKLESASSETIIHKFSIAENDLPKYVATGAITGTLPTNSKQSLNLAVIENRLHLVTSNNAKHQLFILEEENGVLLPTTSNKNDDSILTFGRSNEDLIEARFIGNKIYTLMANINDRNEDALYIIELDDAFMPRISERFLIPSYTKIIQPLPNDQLVLLSQERSKRNSIISELYDTAQPTPLLIENFVLATPEYSYSLKSSKHNAITINHIEPNRTRLTFPFRYTNLNSEIRVNYQLLELDSQQENKIFNKGILDVEDSQIALHDKLVSHNDTLFIVHGEDYQFGTWESAGVKIDTLINRENPQEDFVNAYCSSSEKSYLQNYSSRLKGEAYPLITASNIGTIITMGGDFEDSEIGLDSIEYNFDPNFVYRGNSSAKLVARDFLASLNDSNRGIQNISFWIYYPGSEEITLKVESDSILMLCGGSYINHGFTAETRDIKEEVTITANSWQNITLPFEVGNIKRRLKIAPKNTDDTITFYLDDLQFF